MIFYKLDYVIETEQARQRQAAQCAAYAKPRGARASSSSSGESWTKLVGALKRLAKEYVTHQGWKAHEGVFVPVPPAAGAGARFAPVRRRVDPVRELKRLAGVKLAAREAEVVWLRLLEHKWYLSERLGRDVGLRVAAADYFENIEPPRRRAPQAPAAWEPLPRLPMMLSFGERG